MRALGRKATCFFGDARPKCNARAHLKQRKNIVALCLCVAYGLFSKSASKMGYVCLIDKNDVSLCKLGNI